MRWYRVRTLALGPTLGAAARAVASDATRRFSHVLNDRRLQLCVVCGIWACTGYAGRTVLLLSLFTLVRGGPRGRRRGVEWGVSELCGTVFNHL